MKPIFALLPALGLMAACSVPTAPVTPVEEVGLSETNSVETSPPNVEILVENVPSLDDDDPTRSTAEIDDRYRPGGNPALAPHGL